MYPPSLLDAAPPAISKRIAMARLETLRDDLSATLSKPGTHNAVSQIKQITAAIAEMRKIVGPPVYFAYYDRQRNPE